MKKYAMETTVGIFVLIGLLCIGYMTVRLGKTPFFGDKTYPLNARFLKVTGLRTGSYIEIRGIKVGHVESLTLDQENQAALAQLRIRNGVMVYDDAIASIKTEGMIGDCYLSIDPGGSGELLKAGDTILDTEPPLDFADLIGRYAFGNIEKK